MSSCPFQDATDTSNVQIYGQNNGKQTAWRQQTLLEADRTFRSKLRSSVKMELNTALKQQLLDQLEYPNEVASSQPRLSMHRLKYESPSLQVLGQHNKENLQQQYSTPNESAGAAKKQDGAAEVNSLKILEQQIDEARLHQPIVQQTRQRHDEKQPSESHSCEDSSFAHLQSLDNLRLMNTIRTKGVLSEIKNNVRSQLVTPIKLPF